MPTNPPKENLRKSESSAPSVVKKSHKSKGKRHVLHAESLDHMAREMDLNRSGAYVTAVELSRILRGEARRIRSILR